MFKRSFMSGLVKSSDGYEVSFHGLFLLLYKSKGEKIFIEAEKLADKDSWAIYSGRMHRNTEDGPLVLDPAERQMVVDRAVRAMEFIDVHLEVN